MLRERVLTIRRSERRLEDRYVLACGMIVGCIVAFSVLSDGKIGRLIVVAMEGLTLIVILRASQARPRTVQVVSGMTLAALVVVGLSSTAGGTLALVAPGVLGATLALIAPVVIVRRLAQRATVDVMTIAGALSIYLLVGLFFAFLYWTIGAIQGNFFAQQTVVDGTDYVYFSFVTLTTTGFGDLTAGHDLGRMLAVLEALFGQLYLVSVVALLVSNIGNARRTR